MVFVLYDNPIIQSSKKTTHNPIMDCVLYVLDKQAVTVAAPTATVAIHVIILL
jgi:hypothetical protein